MIPTNKNALRTRLILCLLILLIVAVSYIILDKSTNYKTEKERGLNETITSAFNNGTIWGQASAVNYIIGNKVYPLEYIGDGTEISWGDKSKLCLGIK